MVEEVQHQDTFFQTHLRKKKSLKSFTRLQPGTFFKSSFFLVELQERKLRRELELVKGNVMVMSQMLNELVPGQSKPDDTELLQVRSSSQRLQLHR